MIDIHYLNTKPDAPAMLAYIWIQLKRDGVLSRTFTDRSIETIRDFINLLETSHVYLPVVDQKPVGCFWLNGWQLKAARMHFFFFKEFYRCSFDVGIYVNHYLFRLKDEDGDNYIESMYGLTPKSNRLAVRYIQSIGWQLRGELQGSSYNARTGEREPSVLSIITREHL